MNKKYINNDGVVLFNEECGICNFEINHYKKKSKLRFKNCSQLGDKYLKQLHIKFPDNSELVGVDAFIYVWNHTKGFEFLSKVIKVPIIYSISKLVYKVVALILFYRFKIKKKLVS